jgi:hypothetical protein
MTGFLPIGFAAPLLLGALVLLPAIWWLFRLTPPRPREQSFPATRLLARLVRQEEQPVRTPWWLTLLRVVLAAAVILALAGMIWRPASDRDTAAGPLVLVVDNGWAAGPDWEAIRTTAERLVGDAESRGRPVALALTAEGRGQSLAPTAAAEARRRLAGAVPRPWPSDRAGLVDGLAAAAADAPPGSIAFVTDRLADADAPGFLAGLRRIAGAAPVHLYADPARPLAAITDAANGAEAMEARVVRLDAAAPAAALALRALDGKGRELGRVPVVFADGATATTARLDLPADLRNEIVRLELPGVTSAGAVRLVDERWRRRAVGLVAGTKTGAEQPLLSPLHYLRQAMAPFADLREAGTDDTAGAIAQLIKARVSVIALADIGTFTPDAARDLERFVADGGVLIRFAGPRLALGQERDRLVPVELRRGGRSLGGALTWGEPQKLAPFPATGPFAGMALPTDVTVSRQVLAEPRPDLDGRTWASLADGTPLVTGNRLGRGFVVLFHVTADASWSTLPLSGSFIEMLRRTVAFSVAASGPPTGGGATSLLPPYRLLDGLGRPAGDVGAAEPLDAAGLDKVAVDRRHPPGLYGSADGVVALNLLKPDTTLTALDTAALGPAARHGLGPAAETDLKPWLVAAAALLLLADAAVVVVMAGGLRGRRLAGVTSVLAAVALVVALAPATPARADAAPDPARDAFDLSAALGTRLAYVVTGDSSIDEISRAGLEGLSRVLADRTALEPAAPQAVDVERDDLAFFPILYWPVDAGAAPPSPRAIARIDAYMKNGGTILFDTRDTLVDLNLRGAGRGSRANEALRAILADLDIPPLEPVPDDHVLTKAFYMLTDFPGRYAGGPLWVEAVPARDPDGAADRPVRASDGVTPIMITGNDFAGAWATGRAGEFLLPTVPPDPRQREIAYRVGVNIVMYALTGNYKADQVHVPAILERLGQ